MEIKGIPSSLINNVAVRLVAEFLDKIEKNYPEDFQKIITKVTQIKPLEEDEIKKGTLGMFIPEISSVTREKDYKFSSLEEFQKQDEEPSSSIGDYGTVCIKESIENPDILSYLIAHEFGHVCTTEEDLEKRCAPIDEWASEAAAEWYVFKWGMGKLSRKKREDGTTDLVHHGPLPGQTTEIHTGTWILSDDFVFSKIS